jgi:hypothetical protein
VVALTVLVAILFGSRPTPQTMTRVISDFVSSTARLGGCPERLPADRGTENGHVEINVDMMFQLYSRHFEFKVEMTFQLYSLHFEFNVDMLTLKSKC